MMSRLHCLLTTQWVYSLGFEKVIITWTCGIPHCQTDKISTKLNELLSISHLSRLFWKYSLFEMFVFKPQLNYLTTLYIINIYNKYIYIYIFIIIVAMKLGRVVFGKAHKYNRLVHVIYIYIYKLVFYLCRIPVRRVIFVDCFTFSLWKNKLGYLLTVYTIISLLYILYLLQ